MIPIKVILIAGVLLVGVEYFAKLRSRLRDRILIICFVVAATGLVVFPDYTTKVAHSFGVGRGTDLLFYFSLLGVGFVIVLLFSSLREIEAKLTQLTREIALLRAEETTTRNGREA